MTSPTTSLMQGTSDRDVLPAPMVQTLMGGIPQLAAILGNEDEARRALVNAVVAIQKNPELLKADPQSLFFAIVQVAQWGLEIGTTAHMVPFFSSKAKKTLVTPMKNYKGVIALVIAAKAARSIDAKAVYEGEEFQCEYGTNAFIRHIPDFEKRKNSAKLVKVYAIAHIGLNVPPKFVVLDRSKVEHYRAMSKFSDSSFWRDHYEAMAMKTAVHRLGDQLPQSPRIQAIFASDEPAEDVLAMVGGEMASRLTGEIAEAPAPEGAAPTPSAPSAPVPAAEAPAETPSPAKPPTGLTGKLMPFGQNKGKPITELADKDLLSAISWCTETPEKAEKFRTLIIVLRAEEKARLNVRPGKEVPSTDFEEPPNLLADDGLPDLPF